MADITITKGAIGEELGVSEANGQTEEGIEFIDSYSDGQFTVVDSGRIILANESVTDFVAAGRAFDLNVQETDNDN